MMLERFEMARAAHGTDVNAQAEQLRNQFLIYLAFVMLFSLRTGLIAGFICQKTSFPDLCSGVIFPYGKSVNMTKN